MKTLPARREHGFSLIELMVSITIGLILTMLIGQIFINSRMVFASTDSLGRLQENARYALSMLSREVRTSTYKTDPRAPRNLVFPIGTTPALSGTDGGMSGLSGLPDTLTVRFQGSNTTAGVADGTIQDCLGARIAGSPALPTAQTMVVNTFLIMNDPSNNNEPTLFCNTGTAACVPATPPALPCMPLVPGVENMQIVYGEDKVGAPPATLSPDGSVDRFVDASQVANWDNVLSVRVSLLMRTEDRVANAPTPNTVFYTMSGTNVYAPGTDTRLRRVFTTVIDLRNRTQ